MPKWAWGELKGDLRFCKCGDISTEWEMHVCRLEDKVTDNPINAIEDKNGMMDMGRMGFHVYSGAMEEGATQEVAMMVMIGYFAGIAASNSFRIQDEDETDEHSN